ncbi:hypothetical protein RDI58_009629 [Solanum bulbocastanum]|uniref:Uncharacterized protein n=1 Tax=Solanum bulbocastanum TaxID=147425 RepID=A0AAN8TL87_SOLBU
MFRNNRAANNGMNLSYIPPQIMNGQTMVLLEEKEVQAEEDKWKCALIAYEQVREQEQEPKQMVKKNSSHSIVKKGNLEIEQAQDNQTPGEICQINLRPNAGGKQLDFSFSNFPILATIPTRNGFESLMHSKLASLPIDRGGAPKSC